jgi:hypothetical protein
MEDPGDDSTPARSSTMKLSDFYNDVSRRVDTGKTAISVAETKRVLSEAFMVLEKMDASDMADTIAKGLATAKKKRTK